MEKYITNLRLIENSKLIGKMGFKVKLLGANKKAKNPVIVDTKNNEQLIVERFIDNDVVTAKTKDNRKISIDLDEARISLLKHVPKKNLTWGIVQELTSTSNKVYTIRNYGDLKEGWTEDLMIINNYRSSNENNHIIESLLDMPKDLWGNDETKKEIIGTTKIIVEPRILTQRNIIGAKNAFIQIFPDKFITATKKGRKGSYDTIRTVREQYPLEDSNAITECAYKLCKKIMHSKDYGQLEMIKTTLQDDYGKMIAYAKKIKY